MRGALRQRPFLCALLIAAAGTSCQVDSELQPDEVLRSELGLTDRDEVHRVVITGGDVELAEPQATTIQPGRSWRERTRSRRLRYCGWTAGTWWTSRVALPAGIRSSWRAVAPRGTGW